MSTIVSSKYPNCFCVWCLSVRESAISCFPCEMCDFGHFGGFARTLGSFCKQPAEADLFVSVCRSPRPRNETI